VANFQVRIYTQEKMVYEGEITSLIVPGEAGYLGVLANHAPLVSTLGEGLLTIRKGSDVQTFSIAGGFLEVHDNEATVLADRMLES